MANARYSVDYAKRVSNCKKCKQSLEKGCLRVAKVVPNPFSESAGDMKQYFHPKCIFETFAKAKSTTKIIESAEDVENWADLEQSDKDDMLKLIKDMEENRAKKGKGSATKTTKATPKKTPTKKPAASSSSADGKQKTLDEVFGRKKDDDDDEEEHSNDNDDEKDDDEASKQEESASPTKATDESHPDNSLIEFRKLCSRISAVASYNQKTEKLKQFLDKGSDGSGFEGDLYLLTKLLLPGVVKRVYNINSKQLVKHFSQIFGVGQTEMLDHFNSGGDVADTVEFYFKASKRRPPCNQSTLTIQEWLEEMTKYTKEEDQQNHLNKIAKRCTAEDLTTIIRLLKHDLRINAGAKHILDALDPNAYPAFQASRNLKNVITKIMNQRTAAPGLSKALSISIQLGTPVLPMLAEACRSVEYAMKKCPNGMFAEIKYDGERVQVHKKGSDFVYYSRSLKPVQPHKVSHFKDFLPKAFPGGGDLILDAEVLLVDTKTSKPLPFGSLGVHKKNAFTDANVCLFVFDCLLFQSQSLMDKSLKERKEILDKNMTEIPNRIMFSEMEHIKTGNKEKLQKMINRAISDGLEGLVLKDVESIYEPGKRHWLKVKKDYLQEGAMADSADLIVLGAFYGTGNKGGLMSVFLMGCYDPKKNKFCTVTKCGNGHDDATIDKINKQMKSEVDKISKDYNKLPNWLLCTRQLVPDFVVKDPKKAPVWEIAGAEFSASDAHTADGISIRFPRVTKIRDDKNWKTATNLDELKVLFAKSKEKSDFVEEEPEIEDKEAEEIAEEHSLNKKLKEWDADDETVNDDGESSKQADTSSASSRSPHSVSTSPKKRESSKTPTKRRAPESDDDQPSPKKKKPRVACKYGMKCYQKNPEHKKSFWHPGDKDEPMKSDEDDNEEETNEEEIFSNLKLYLPENLDKRKELLRYVNYFGGEVVDDQEDATHIIDDDDDGKKKHISSKGKVVTSSWLWDCIKKRKVLPLPKS